MRKSRRWVWFAGVLGSSLAGTGATADDLSTTLSTAPGKIQAAIELHEQLALTGTRTRLPFKKSIELCFKTDLVAGEIGMLRQHSLRLALAARSGAEHILRLNRELSGRRGQGLGEQQKQAVDIDRGARQVQGELHADFLRFLDAHQAEANGHLAAMKREADELLALYSEEMAGKKIDNPSRSNCRALPSWAKQAFSRNHSNGVSQLLQAQEQVLRVLSAHAAALRNPGN